MYVECDKGLQSWGSITLQMVLQEPNPEAALLVMYMYCVNEEWALAEGYRVWKQILSAAEWAAANCKK